MKRYKTAILGATFYGMAKVMQMREECILIERSTLIGSEFVDSFNEKGGKVTEVKSEFGRMLKKALTENRMINDKGEIYAAPALFLMCGFLEKINLNIMFATEIMQIKRESGIYKITCFNSGGISEIEAENIIDTTSRGVLHDGIKGIEAKKSLNVIVGKYDKRSLQFIGNVVRNSLADITVFRFPVELDDNRITAREKLHRFWKENGEALENCKMELYANTFAYIMQPLKKEIDTGFLWIPSCGYDNLLQAADEGGE